MKTKKDGNKLIIELQLQDEKTAPLSRTGRSRVAYSTRGFIPVDEKTAINLNVIYRA